MNQAEMTSSYMSVLLGLQLLCMCSCNAAITLESFPEHVVTTCKNVETTFYCWVFHDTSIDVRLRFKLNGLSLDDGSLIRTTAGQCDQGLVPVGQHCENITARIPGDMSLDQTTLTCSLLQFEGSSLLEGSEELSATIVIIDQAPTPDYDGTSVTEPTTTTMATSMPPPTDEGDPLITALESFPEHVITTCKNGETTFYCWVFHDTSIDVRLRFKLNGLSLDDGSLIRTTAGQCNQGLVPVGQHCENITARIPGNMSLDQTTLTCSLLQLEGLNLFERSEQLNVTIVITDQATIPDYDCTSVTEPTNRRTSKVVLESGTSSGTFSHPNVNVTVSVLPVGGYHNSNGSLVTVISVSVAVGGLVLIPGIILLIVVGVLIVKQRKKFTHDNQHINESISPYALETQYNMTLNDAYALGTKVSVAQQSMANVDEQSSMASHSYETIEGDEMKDSEGQLQVGSPHEHERNASVCGQAGDDYEQAQCYELAAGVYEQVKGQDYEQTSDPYERVQDYEQHQVSGPYDQVQSYERLQVRDQQDPG